MLCSSAKDHLEYVALACQRLEAEEELAHREVSAPDLPTRQEVRKADPMVEFVMAPKMACCTTFMRTLSFIHSKA